MILRAGAATVLTATAVLLPAPAGAVTYATQADHLEVRHYAPDAGYDRDLLVRCGSQGFVIIEGTSSTRFRDVFLGPDCKGVTSIYVRPGEEWWRLRGDGRWERIADASGWRRLAETFTDKRGITVRED